MKVQNRSIALVLYSLLLVASATAASPSNPSPWIAVMPYHGLGIDSSTALQTEEAMSDGLAQTKKVRVMERSQMSVILREQSFQNSGACDSSECAVQTGKLLGVDLVVVGSIGRFGTAYTLSARAVKVQTGEVVYSSRRVIKGELDAVLTIGVPSLSRELAFALAGEPIPVENTSQPVPPKDSQKSSSWGWWLGGTVLVATATGASWFLLVDKKSTSSSSDGDVTTVNVVLP